MDSQLAHGTGTYHSRKLHQRSFNGVGAAKKSRWQRCCTAGTVRLTWFSHSKTHGVGWTAALSGFGYLTQKNVPVN